MVVGGWVGWFVGIIEVHGSWLMTGKSLEFIPVLIPAHIGGLVGWLVGMLVGWYVGWLVSPISTNSAAMDCKLLPDTNHKPLGCLQMHEMWKLLKFTHSQ